MFAVQCFACPTNCWASCYNHNTLKIRNYKHSCGYSFWEYLFCHLKFSGRRGGEGRKAGACIRNEKRLYCKMTTSNNLFNILVINYSLGCCGCWSSLIGLKEVELLMIVCAGLSLLPVSRPPPLPPASRVPFDISNSSIHHWSLLARWSWQPFWNATIDGCQSIMIGTINLRLFQFTESVDLNNFGSFCTQKLFYLIVVW